MSIANLLLSMAVTMLIPTLPLWMMQALHFSREEVGLIMGVFAVGLFLPGVFCSYLVQQRRRNLVFVWCVLLLGLSMVLPMLSLPFFNRPLVVDIYLNITVTEYPEEALPPNAQTLITEAVIDYGNSLTVGNDVILQRFMGAIYSAVSGIGYISITASTDGVTYSTNNISIDSRHVASFDATRVQVTIS